MRKIGISLNINLDKVDKTRIYEGKKGKYLNLTTFVNIDEQGEYGDNGFVTQSQTKEERANGLKLPIVGNNKLIYSTMDGAALAAGSEPSKETPDANDDIPF